MGLGGGGSGSDAALHVYASQARPTPYVILVCVVAASGGLLFGYDLGVTGGVTQMPSFLAAFFPHIAAAQKGADASPWCTFDDPRLQLFTSSLFLAGTFSTLLASWVSSFGRKASMLLAGVCFLGGVGLCAGAAALPMLICGRVLLGLGVGLANQCVPVYLSEQAPAAWRGRLNILFQLATTFGLLVAQLINLGASHLEPWGWRLRLALAGEGGRGVGRAFGAKTKGSRASQPGPAGSD